MIYLFLFLFFHTISLANVNIEFENWKKNFKKIALKNNISEATFDLVMSNTSFLPNVIKYDRYQPEFYEDTKTYISKRANNKKVNSGIKVYNINKKVIDKITNEFLIVANRKDSKGLIKIGNELGISIKDLTLESNKRILSDVMEVLSNELF